MLLDYEKNTYTAELAQETPIANIIKLAKSLNLVIDQSVLDCVYNLPVPAHIIEHTRPEKLEEVWTRIKSVIVSGGCGIMADSDWQTRLEVLCGYAYIIDEWPIAYVCPKPYLKSLSSHFIKYFENKHRVNIFDTALIKYSPPENKVVFSKTKHVPNCDIYLTDFSGSSVNNSKLKYSMVIFEGSGAYTTGCQSNILSTNRTDKRHLISSQRELRMFLGTQPTNSTVCGVTDFAKGTTHYLNEETLDFFF